MAFDSRIFIAFLVIIFISVGTDAIKCYQNQSRLNEPAPGVLTECSSIGMIRATGCVKHILFSTNTVTRLCEYNNCTENGYDRSKACYNATDGSNSMTCCCLTDGCNSAPTIITSSYYTLLFAIPSIIFGLYFTQ